MSDCFLEGCLGGESVYRIPLISFPALVGRESGLAVTLQSGNVSRHHAEFLQQDGELLVRDLGSTNGTFVNHKPVSGSVRLSPGDVVRFADVEFRLRLNRPAVGRHAVFEPTVTTFFTPDRPADRLPIGAGFFEQLLRDKLIKPLFQPIISPGEKRIAGLELLGRGTHPELSELPAPLFSLAVGLGLAIDLSEAIDDFGAGQARLLELLDRPPYAVKFDISLVRDLDRQTVERQEMIGLLVRLVKKGRSLALAEGVSRAGELAVCRQLDFDLIQGYVYGTPASLEQLESARKCQAGHGWRSAGR